MRMQVLRRIVHATLPPSRSPRPALIVVFIAVSALVLSSCDWAQPRFGPDGTGPIRLLPNSLQPGGTRRQRRVGR